MSYGMERKQSLLLWDYVRLTAFNRFAVERKRSLLYWGYFFVGAAHTRKKLSFLTSNYGGKR